MNEKVKETITKVREYWSNQPKKNKIIYISGLVAVIVIGIIIAVLLNRKEYVVLYQGLETTEAAEIVALIEEAGYSCTLSNGTITVPKGTEDTLAMTLAMQRYPKSNLNYESYTSRVGMFTTESEKKEYARMAEEERLSAAIASLNDVRSAIVNLSFPEKKNTVISAYTTESSASATIVVEKNKTLSSAQVEGITYLIAHATGIKTEFITLVDGDGVLLLAEDTPADVVAEETKKLKFKTDLELQIKQKIAELLVPAYGEDGFSSAVNMVLNFDTKVSEDTVYTPSTNDERGMLQHTDAEQASGNAVANGGVVGVEVNADDTYPTGNTNGNGQWTENSVSNTYLINTYKEQVEKAGYVIDGLSISVVIYTDYLPETTRAELVSLVGNAATVNPEIVQDVVSVTNLTKYEDKIEDIEKTYLFGLKLNQLVILGAILLGILIILIIVLVSLSSKSKKRRKTFEKQLLEQHALPEDEPLVDSFFVIEEGAHQKIDVPSLIAQSGVETKETIIKRELGDFARQSPEIVAQLLRNWIKEEEKHH